MGMFCLGRLPLNFYYVVLAFPWHNRVWECICGKPVFGSFGNALLFNQTSMISKEKVQLNGSPVRFVSNLRKNLKLNGTTFLGGRNKAKLT